MKALFIHSHVFLYDKEENVYSEGKLTYETWLRYLAHFDKLTVLGRHKTVKYGKGLVKSSGEKVHHIKLPNTSDLVKYYNNKIISNQIIREEVQKCDVLIARLPSTYSITAIQFARELNKPYVIELVGDVFSSLWYHGNPLAKAMAVIQFQKTRNIVKRAPYIYYVTSEYLQKKYPSQQAKVLTSCSNVELPEQRESIVIKKHLKTTNIGLIGSYTSKYKGMDNAIRVVKKLNDNGYKSELRILGSGNDRVLKDIIDKNYANDFVKLDGSRNHEGVMQWLEEIDIYIQPSLTEGLPRALIEAMSVGLPCAASNVGGIPELLAKDALHNPRDEKRMYDIIKKMIENFDLRKEYSSRNYKVAAEYSKVNLTKKREEFWDLVLKDIIKEQKK